MAKKQDKSRKAKSKSKKRIWIGLSVLFSAIIIWGVIFIHTNGFKSFLWAKLTHYLQVRYNLSLKAESFDLNPLRLSIALEGIQVKPDPNTDSLIQHLAARKLLINIAFSTLISGKIHVQEIQIIDPRFTLSRHQPEVKPVKLEIVPSKRPISLKIDRFTMEDGFVSIRNEGYPVSASIESIEISGSYQNKKKLHSAHVRSEKGKIQFNESRLEINELYTDFEFDDEFLRINRFIFRTDPLSLTASGKVTNFLKNPRYDFEASGSLLFDRISGLLPVNHKLKGLLSFSASMKGSEKNISMRGNLLGKEMSVADISFPEIKASIQTDTKNITVTNLEVTSTKGKLTGKIDLDLSERRDSSAELQWNDVDLSGFELWEPRLLPRLSTATSGRLSAKWDTMAIDSIKAKGEIEFKPSSLSFPDVAERYELSGNIKFAATEGQIRLTPSSIRLNQTEISLSGTLDNTKKFKSDFKIAMNDLAEIDRLFNQLEADILFTGNPALLPVPKEGQLYLEGSACGTIINPEVDIKLTGRNISLYDIRINQTEGRFAYDQEGMTITGLNLQLSKGSIQAQGLLAYNLGSHAFGDNSRLTINADRVDVSSFASFYKQKDSVKGFISGEFEFTGTPENPRIQFQVRNEHFAFKDEDIDLSEFQGRFINHNLQVENIRIHKGTGRLEGSLGFDLLSKEFRVDLKGQDIELSDFKTGMSRNSFLSGLARFHLRGNGSLEKPVFNLLASVDRMMVSSAYLNKFEIKAESDGQAVTIDSRSPLGQTSLKARLLLQDPFIIRGSIKTQALDAWNTFRYQVEQQPSPIASEITAEAMFVLPLKDWKQFTARIVFDKIGFRYINFPVQNHKPFAIQINTQEIDLETAKFQGPDTELTVSGKLPLNDSGEGKIFMNGTVNLHIFQAFLANSEIAGSLLLSGTISGTVVNPVMNARIELKDSLLDMAAIPYSFHDIAMTAEIKNNVLDLSKLVICMDEGRISAKGRIFIPFPGRGSSQSKTGQGGHSESEITIALTALDLGKLADLLPERPAANVGGLLEGALRIRGDIFSADRIEIDGELTKLEIQLSKFKMTSEEKIRLQLRERVFRLDNLRLTGGNSFIQTGLTLYLGDSPQLEARLSSVLDVSILTPLFEDIILDGNLRLDLECMGHLHNLGLNGKGRISRGLFQLQNWPLFASEIEGDIQLSYKEPATFSLSGILNGGKTKASGKIAYSSNQLKSAELGVAADQIQINYPVGFQGLSNGNFTLTSREQKWFLSGDLEFTQSYFNADIYPGSELVKNLRSQQRALKSDIPIRIRDLHLDIGLTTINPFILDNNLASIELDSSIRVGGTVYEPRLSGYVRNKQAGEIIFANRSYEVEKMSMNYTDADPLEGMIDVIAHTQMRHHYDNLNVLLTVTGPIANLSFSLNSSPPRSQIELASLLITGYGTERLRDEASNILGNQIMLYFLSPIASPFTSRLKTFLGAEDVRIEPINIATEEDPGARFTFRKGLIRTLDLIYSIDISNTQRQTWILDYNLSRNFSVQSFTKDNGSYGGSFSHRFFLGSPSKTRTSASSHRNKQYKIKDIEFSGNLRFSKEKLEKEARDLKRGSVFYYRNLRLTIDKLTAFYKEKGHLNAVISSSLDFQKGETITITLHISPKDPAKIIFVGDPIKTTLKKEIIRKWNGRLPEEMSVAEAEKQIRLDLNSKGYIEVKVNASKTEEKQESLYVFIVNFGPEYRIGQFAIAGDSAVSSQFIKKAVAGIPRTRGKGLWALLYDFKRSKLRIESLYEETGYQNAVVKYPETSPNKERKTLDISLPVQQGIQSRIHSITVNGNHSFLTREIKALLRLQESDIFSSLKLAADTNMLYSFYRGNGYHDVNIDVQTKADRDRPQTDIVYNIKEGDIHLISLIEISGNNRTPDHVIRRELVFREGDPLNMEKIIASQKNLYDMLVFRTVNIRPEFNAQQRYKARVVVEVQEDPRFGVNYGLRYNSEEKLEVFGQLDLINIFGRGRSGLIFYKKNDRQKDLRFSLKDPYIFGKKFNTLYSISYLEETLSVFKSEEFGFTVQQELSLPLDSSISYLFRLNRIHTYEIEPIGPFPFDFTLFLPEFQTFWVRDTRLNKINAKQGSFLSLSSRYSPSFLKTDLTYISFFGQYSLYLRILPFMIWASNYRIGLADAFDQVLIPSRRFFAGGSNSIRGFERDTVGPQDPYLKRPTGGEALFIVNQELRFPLFKWLEGVVFFDMGNVYRYINEFNPLEIRTAAGFGLRFNIPAVFLRFDYGINLTPREFEPKTVFYVSIGQAF